MGGAEGYRPQDPSTPLRALLLGGPSPRRRRPGGSRPENKKVSGIGEARRTPALRGGPLHVDREARGQDEEYAAAGPMASAPGRFTMRRSSALAWRRLFDARDTWYAPHVLRHHPHCYCFKREINLRTVRFQTDKQLSNSR